MTAPEKILVAGHVLAETFLAFSTCVLALSRVCARLPPESKAAFVNWLSPRPFLRRVFSVAMALGPNVALLDSVAQTVATQEGAGWAIAILRLINGKKDVELLPSPPDGTGARPASLRPVAVARVRVDGLYSQIGSQEKEERNGQS